MGIVIDFAVGIIILIALVVGLRKGFAKQFSKSLCALVAVAAATFLSSIVINKLLEIPTVSGWASIPAGWFSPPALNTAVDLTLSVEEGTAAVQGLLNEGFWQLLAMFSATFFDGMVTSGLPTLAEYFGLVLLKLALDIVLWTVIYIIIYGILKGISKLLTTISRHGFFKFLDRLIGMVWSLAWAYAIVVGIVLSGAEIIMSKWLPDIQETFYTYLQSSVLLTYAHNTNFIGNVMATLLNTTLPTLPFGS